MWNTAGARGTGPQEQPPLGENVERILKKDSRFVSEVFLRKPNWIWLSDEGLKDAVGPGFSERNVRPAAAKIAATSEELPDEASEKEGQHEKKEVSVDCHVAGGLCEIPGSKHFAARVSLLFCS